MPYAANGIISHSPIDGGIQITQGQYDEALSIILSGGSVSIENGFSLIEPKSPEQNTEPPQDINGTPLAVTRRQGRKALLRTPYNGGGNMLDAVETLIASIPDPIERREAQIDYEADTWERGNSTLQAMWAQLGGTEQQLDDLFVLASTL